MEKSLLKVYVLLLLLSPFTGFSQTKKAVASGNFSAFMQKWIQSEPFAHATIGVSVQDVETSQILYSQMPQIGFATGSAMKAITTAAALSVLSPSFTFQTELIQAGNIDGSGTLFGNIVIKGGGDPTLGAENFEEVISTWAATIKSRGIKKIEGQIIGDASFFDERLIPDTWIWEDLGNYYGSGAAGLNIRKNTYDLYLKPGSNLGDAVEIISTYPLLPGNMSFKSEVTSAEPGSGDQTYIFGAPYTYHRILRGTIPIGREPFRVKGSVPDPALFVAFQLHEALTKQEITITQLPTAYPSLTDAPPNLANSQVLTTENSLPLAQIAKETNHESINLYAEALFKMLGKKTFSDPGISGGQRALKQFLKESSVDTSGFFAEDGSGLSPYNLITPQQATALLTHIHGLSIGSTFKATLPVLSKSGTLRSMNKNRPASGKVYGKSGYIKRVRAYMGYATTNNGRIVAFFVSVNNFLGDYKELTPHFEDFFDSLVTNF